MGLNVDIKMANYLLKNFGTMLIFNLDSGTFDVSILTIDEMRYLLK